jgi:hypothetical protein
MAKTAVGLFRNLDLVAGVVQDLEANGFPRKEILVLGEPSGTSNAGVLGIPRTDFEVDLTRELRGIGAAEPDAEAYVQGVRSGGAIIFATASDDRADVAAEIMNRHSPVEVEELRAVEPNLPGTGGEYTNHVHDSSVQFGRVRFTGGGARLFVW